MTARRDQMQEHRLQAVPSVTLDQRLTPMMGEPQCRRTSHVRYSKGGTMVAPENGLWSRRSLKAIRRYPHALPRSGDRHLLARGRPFPGTSSALVAATAMQLG